MANEQIYTDGTYFDKNQNWHIEDSAWKARHIMRMLEKNKIQPSSVCEVGCGAGEILKYMHEHMPAGINFSGFEISPQAHEISLSRAKPGLEFFLKDILSEPVHFDVALIIDVIEHIPDFYNFLTKIKEKAEYKIFHIPLDLSVQTVLRSTPILAGRKQVGHIHYFTKETAIAALEDMGYTIIDQFYTAGMIELPNKPFRSKLLNLPRRFMYKINSHWAVRVLGGYSLMVLAK